MQHRNQREEEKTCLRLNQGGFAGTQSSSDLGGNVQLNQITKERQAREEGKDTPTMVAPRRMVPAVKSARKRRGWVRGDRLN